jgi:predicted GNAT superfamily acetyltransferase
MIKTIFFPPTAREMAIKEKAEAERLLLEAQTAKEFATQMEAYHAGRVTRLDAYLKTFDNTPT